MLIFDNIREISDEINQTQQNYFRSEVELLSVDEISCKIWRKSAAIYWLIQGK